jgi:hypothetical protein
VERSIEVFDTVIPQVDMHKHLYVFTALLLWIQRAESFAPTTLTSPRGIPTSASLGESWIATSGSFSLPSSALYMHNKKKPSKKANSGGGSGGKGFASTSVSTVISITDSFPYAGSVRPGQQSPQRVVMDEKITLPDYAIDGRPKKGSSSPLLPWVIEVKTADEIEKMRASGKLAREVLDMAGRVVAPGVTTDEIDTLVHEAIVAAGAYPSPLNYHGTNGIH